MTSQDQPTASQRLPCKEGIAEAPIPSPAGPRRLDDEPMMKLRRRTPIVCDRVGRNGASQRSRAKTTSPRQALDQPVVVDGIKSCRKIEQAEQCMISRINRLNEVGHDLDKRSLRRMALSIGWLRH